MKNKIFKIIYPLFARLRNFYYMFSGAPHAAGYIFMLHRVDDRDPSKLSVNEDMNVSPKYLDSFLTEIEKECDIIRIEDVPNRLKTRIRKKFAVFTMDDGYKDNLYNALPVFQKHNVPYSIFITTNFPDEKAVLWWYELEDLVLTNNTIELSTGKVFSANTKEEKERCFMQIRREILSLDQQKLLPELKALFSKYNIDWIAKCKDLCLNWDELRLLKNEPLVTLGAHTMHHYNLKQLHTKDDLKNEVLLGYHRLIEEGNIKTDVFAYPFGSFNEAADREFQALSEMSQFKLSVRSLGGPVPEGFSDMHSLPRIMLEEGKNIRSLILAKGVRV